MTRGAGEQARLTAVLARMRDNESKQNPNDVEAEEDEEHEEARLDHPCGQGITLGGQGDRTATLEADVRLSWAGPRGERVLPMTR